MMERMASWADVERLGLALPGTEKGEAHEGSPAIYVGRNQFARLRWDGDRRENLVESWTARATAGLRKAGIA
jgi:hypothetical protein